jgi:hypothetical protein
MRRMICGALLMTWISACSEKKAPTTRRAEVRKVSGEVVEIVPTAGQFAFCLVFTTARNGVIRQLTIRRDNLSVRCEGSVPIGKTTYRIPADEGPVKIRIFFSDQRLDASSVAQQIAESVGTPDFNPVNFRLPGRVYVETLEYAPTAEPEPTMGTVVGKGNDTGPPKAQSPDGGRSKPAL